MAAGRHMGRSASISRLPVELVCLCFALLSLRDRVHVSHVSKRWRSMATSCPTLWRRLEFHHQPQHRDTFLSILERARGLQLDAIWDCSSAARAGLDVLEAEFPRVRVLSIKRHGSHGDHEELLDRLLGRFLPSLEELYLQSSSPFVIPHHWSAGGAPRLRKLAMSDSFLFSPTCDRFPSLRALRGNLSEYRDTAQDPRIILDLCPELAELELSCVDQRMLNCFSVFPIPKTLRRLCLLKPTVTGTSSLDYQPLVDALGRMPDNFTASRAAHICGIVKHYATHVFTPFSMICRIRYDKKDTAKSILQLSLETADPRAVACRSSAILHDALTCAPFLVSHLSNLTHLECPTEFLRCLLSVSPTLPALCALSIVVADDEDTEDIGNYSLPGDGRLYAPRLRTLTLDTTGMRHHFDFDMDVGFANALSASVPPWLRFDALRLESVRFYVSRSVFHTPAAFSPQVFAHWAEKLFVGWRADARIGLLETGTWYDLGKHTACLV